MQHPSDYYLRSAAEWRAKAVKLQKLYTRLVLPRVLIFFALAALVFFLFSFGLMAGLSAAVGSIVLLAILVFRHELMRKTSKHFLFIESLHLQEAEKCEGKIFPSGGDLKNEPAHPYAGDLDVFGHNSAFSFVNRTATETGKNMLAKWLLNPADKAEIMNRQKLVQALKEIPHWRMDFLATGAAAHEKPEDLINLNNWLKQPYLFLNKKLLFFVIHILPIITVSLVVGWIVFGLSYYFMLMAISVQLFIIYKYRKEVAESHYHLGEKSEVLLKYSKLFKLMEQPQLAQEPLQNLQQPFVQKENASQLLKQVSTHINNLDLRFNIFGWLLVNSLFMWDLHMLFRLERWKERVAPLLPHWFETIAYTDALSSFAFVHFNHPDWCFPSINKDDFGVEAESLGHFLIPEYKRITNDFSLTGNGKIMLITGSNMAGKSTFLRTLGINVVLAMAGAPVCAKRFSSSEIHIHTSMRTIDSLEMNESSFYAELKRIQMILQAVKQKDRVFFLIDEVLKGTNSRDRHKGSVALLQQLKKAEGTGIISTHDLDLAEAAETMDHVQNFSFEVQIENGQLNFDYTLRPGICHSFNASVLMQQMGIM